MKRRTIFLFLSISIFLIIILTVAYIITPLTFEPVISKANDLFFNLHTEGALSGCGAPPVTLKWTKPTSNPVIDIGPAGAWDSGAVSLPHVIFDGSIYEMWFTGQADGTGGDKSTQIGYATSTDGKTWTKYATNPVLKVGSSGSWDSKNVSAPYVIFDSGVYKMWYSGGGDPATSTPAIGYATSTDGINWEKYAQNPVLTVGPTGSWDSLYIAGASVLVDGNTYKIWYMGSDGEEPFLKAQIGYATSSDGVSWVKHTGNPALATSATTAWDSVFFPRVVYNGRFYDMWYSGFNVIPPLSIEVGIGHASSFDGILWHEDSNNLNLIEKGVPNSWDSQGLMLSGVLFQSGEYKLWYTGYASLITESGSVQRSGIGYAASRRSMSDRADDDSGYQLHVMYVVPSDGIDRGLDTNGKLNVSVCAFQKWLVGQTNGVGLRLDTYQDSLDITFLRLSRSNEDIASHGEHVRDEIEADLRTAGFNDPNKLYVVYYDGLSNTACGGGAWPPSLPGHVAALYLQGLPNGNPRCNQNQFATSEDSPGYLEFAMIHEIFHTLGAVATCAPHYNATQPSHVSGDSADLMWAGPTPTIWAPSDLDIDHDDYYGHNQVNCLDLADSTFMDPLPAIGATPPGWP